LKSGVRTRPVVATNYDDVLRAIDGGRVDMAIDVHTCFMKKLAVKSGAKRGRVFKYMSKHPRTIEEP